jgi:class 3 adenylate cyclase
MPDSGHLRILPFHVRAPRALVQAPHRILRFRLSIVTVLAFGFGALVLAAVTGVLAIGLWSASRNTLDLLRDKAEFATEVMVMRTRRHLEPAQDQASFLADLIASGELDPNDRERMADYLLGAMAATPQVRGLAFIGTDFDVLRASRSPEGPVIGMVNWSDDPQVREQMEEARVRTQPYWAELVWSRAADTTLINLRAPVRRKGEFLGYIVSIVTVSDLSRFITGMPGQQAANSFILYGGDYVLAHRSMARGGFPRSPKQPLPTLAQLDDPALAAIWDVDAHGDLPLTLTGETRGHMVRVDGKSYVFIYRQLEIFGDVPWIVGTYFSDDAELRREMSRLILAGAGGLIVLCLALIAAIVLGRRMSRPIQALALAAQSVSSLELSRVRELHHSRVRELDDAANAFNTMLGGLRWFETYVPRSLVRQIIRRGGATDLRSREVEVTVLFTDITGFTALAEHKSAAETAMLLNEHFSLVAGCVEAEDGTIDKYIGDSVMAFWGAPSAVPDHVERACRAALAIRRTVTFDNEVRRRHDEPPITMRIGVHTGPAIAGNIGAPGRINYTLVGDTVNVAQRLVELTKSIGSQAETATVMVSEAVADRLGPEFTLVPEGEQEIRGRAGEIHVFRLIS